MNLFICINIKIKSIIDVLTQYLQTKIYGIYIRYQLKITIEPGKL